MLSHEEYKPAVLPYNDVSHLLCLDLDHKDQLIVQTRPKRDRHESTVLCCTFLLANLERLKVDEQPIDSVFPIWHTTVEQGRHVVEALE